MAMLCAMITAVDGALQATHHASVLSPLVGCSLVAATVAGEAVTGWAGEVRRW